MKATNNFHRTLADVTILEQRTWECPDEYFNGREAVRVRFDQSQLCGMSDCECHGADQRPFVDDWYLLESFI